MDFPQEFEKIVRENVPLSRLTSLKVGGPARFLVQPENQRDLGRVLSALEKQGIPFRVLGGGTNVLAPDEGYGGAVIRLAGAFLDLSFDRERASAGAAVPLPRLVSQCADRGLAGAEVLAGIPGTVGGALVMNAGGRWGQIGSIVESVCLLGPNRESEVVSASRLEFGYRGSSIKGRLVLSAVFRLRTSDAGSVRNATEDYLRRKRATQDLAAPSAGCVFRNPAEGPSAGELIDRCGFKGMRIGGAQVSAVHANFIVNAGGATARDILALAEAVRSKVSDVCATELEYEIELW